MDDELLVKQVLAGDETSFNELVLRYHHPLIRLARAIVGDSIAEEVVQETWISVVKSLAKFEGRSSLKTWMYRILVNKAITRLRYESHRSFDINMELTDNTGFVDRDNFNHRGRWSLPPIAWHEETPDALLQSEELITLLQKKIRELPSAQQSVLIMHDIDDIDMETICNLLNIKLSNSRVLLHRARVQLKKVIDDYQRLAT